MASLRFIHFLLYFQFGITTQIRIRDNSSHDILHHLTQFISSVADCELFFVAFEEEQRRIVLLDWNRIASKSSGIFQVFSLANITFQRHFDIHRLSPSQLKSVAIFSINSFSEQIPSWIFSTLLPNYGPILRKDEDYFIFLTSSTETFPGEILLSENLGSKLKYKVAIDLKSGEMFGINLYGGQLGEHVPAKVKPVPSKRQVDTNVELFPQFPSQLNGKVFKFSIPKVAFRFEIRLFPDGLYHPVRGPYKWYFDEVTKKFNFSYTMVYSSFGGGTGKQLDNGTWVGALSDILYGKADISTMIGLVYSRHKYIGWSSALSYEWMVFVTPSPRKSYSPMAIFWPFEIEMWLLFWVALLIMTISFRVIAQLQGYHGTAWTISSSFEYIYGTFLEQDRNGQVRGSSLKMLTAFWLLFAMVTATAYRGKLVSLIAFPTATWIPVNFEELANSHFKVALNLVGKAGAAYTWVVSSPNPIIRKLANRVEYIREGEKCLERAIHEELGCILWKGVSDYVSVKNLTDQYGHAPLEESKETAMFIKDGWNFEKRAIFGHIFDGSIQAAVSMGLYLKWFQMDQVFVRKERMEWSRQSNQTERMFTQDSGPQELILSQFTGVFVVYFVGVSLAIIQFVQERMSFSCHDCCKCCIFAVAGPL